MPFDREDLSEELDEALEAQAGAEGTDGQDGAAGAAPADGAGSSDAQAKTDEGLLGVVRDAAPAKKPDAAAASPADGAETGDKPDDGAPKKEPAEDYSDVPFNKHPRFRQLLSERNANKGDAERYRQVDTFIRDNGMTANEAADLLTVGAMAKSNPAKAWELARPWVENLLKAAGEVLPAELEQAVREGRMTQEAAFEVSRSRASVASMEASRGFEEQRREQQVRDDHSRSITNAAVEWETKRRERDPNYDTKLEQIHREIAWRHHNGDVPKSAAEVQAQLDDAYKVVTAALKPPAAAPAPTPGRQAPSRTATKPVTGGSVAGGNAKPAPRSMLEVVQQSAG